MIQVETVAWRYECMFCGIYSETFATKEIRDREARRHVHSCDLHPIYRLNRDLADAKADAEFWRARYFEAKAESQFSLAVPQQWVKTGETIIETGPTPTKKRRAKR